MDIPFVVARRTNRRAACLVECLQESGRVPVGCQGEWPCLAVRWDPNASFANGHDAGRVAEYGMKGRTAVRITLADVASALPDLVLAGTFALVWLDPSRPGLPSVRRLVM